MSDPIYPPPDPYGQQPQQPQAPQPQQPPAYPGYGQQPGQPDPWATQQPYGQQPGYGQQQPAYDAPAAGPGRRPGSVTAAGLITIITSTLALLGFGLLALGIVVAREDVESQINDELSGQAGLEDVTAADLTNIVLVLVCVTIFWALCAIVLAALTMRRHNWARIVLVVSASITAIFSLLGITSLVSLVPLAAAIAAIVLLFQKDANAWFAGRPAPPR